MIDRHKSLVHMLMSGLVGLTLGLFIGWWVWPVQWTAAPAAQLAATAPAQSVESPAEGGAAPDASYSALLDWVNQGLLYVAAALLLVGGVVIGYQLLRQSQDKEPSRTTVSASIQQKALQTSRCAETAARQTSPSRR